MLPTLSPAPVSINVFSRPRYGLPHRQVRYRPHWQDGQPFQEHYRQISYTRRMKSRIEHVREEWVEEIRRQIATHKRLKRLIDQWIDVDIEHSKPTADCTIKEESAG